MRAADGRRRFVEADVGKDEPGESKGGERKVPNPPELVLRRWVMASPQAVDGLGVSGQGAVGGRDVGKPPIEASGSSDV